jgi:death on curing protein
VIKGTKYLNFTEAVYLHLNYMRQIGETRCGTFERSLVESALSRPQQAAAYEDADHIRQAATLYYGLIKNHPWVGGNKRTASILVGAFLFRNGVRVRADIPDVIQLVLAIESNQFRVDEIEAWLREHTVPR